VPILPHRYERVRVVPDGPDLWVNFVFDTPVAYRAERYGEPTVHENPFPPDDPRHALTAELLDRLDGSTPGRQRRRRPWHPGILADYGERWLARARWRAETHGRLRLDEAAALPAGRRNRLRREAREAECRPTATAT
jgi:hypothetical protein